MDHKKSESLHAQVIAIGAEVDLPLKKGDAIVYQKYAVAEVEVPDSTLIFVAQKSVIGVMQ